MTPAKSTLVIVVTIVAFVIFSCIHRCKGGDVPDQRARWIAAEVRTRFNPALDANVNLYLRLAPRYERITAMRENGVPAPVLFCLHQRESSGSFLCHPHEGSSLLHRTLYVPKGRIPEIPPPYSFERSAEDAYYTIDRLDLVNWRSVQDALWGIEKFNGTGYAKYHPDVPSPYLWAGTTIYLRGKYVADGRFDRNATDRQLGCVAILKKMKERGVDISFAP